MKFQYIKLGVARIVDGDGVSHPIAGNFIYGVKLKTADGRGQVLGLVQENPSLTNKWRAVAAQQDDRFPSVDFTRGVWLMEPGRSDFGSRREAAVWLLGASDARQVWFKEGEK